MELLSINKKTSLGLGPTRHLHFSGVAKHNKTRFFSVLYSNKTWVFDQSEGAKGPTYIITWNKTFVTTESDLDS